jgi:protease I
MNNADDKKTKKSETAEPNAKKQAGAKNTVSNVSPATHQNTPKASIGTQSAHDTVTTQGAHEDVTKAPENKTPENKNAGANATTQLHGLRVAILATDGFEEAELAEPRKALDEAGAKTTVLAPKGGEIQGFNHDEKAEKVSVDMELAAAKAADFDAVLLPGGAINADALRMNSDAQKFVQEMDKAGKPIAVICHAPWLLISAGLTRGRKMTSYHTIQDDVRNSGANWEDAEVIRDHNWVSSRQPDDIPAFNREMISLFGEKREKSKSAAGR